VALCNFIIVIMKSGLYHSRKEHNMDNVHLRRSMARSLAFNVYLRSMASLVRNYVHLFIEIILVRKKKLTTPSLFQIISYFDFFLLHSSAMYLDITYVSIRSKLYISK
jgi:hypothetical protein